MLLEDIELFKSGLDECGFVDEYNRTLKTLQSGTDFDKAFGEAMGSILENGLVKGSNLICKSCSKTLSRTKTKNKTPFLTKNDLGCQN